jgi:predicted nucleic acid-binding protein
MKVMFDTNIYIGWIRARDFRELLLDYQTCKYLSATVLMELWAGARTKTGSRIVSQLEEPYLKAERVVTLTIKDHIALGQILSDLPSSLLPRIAQASFINDIAIALCARSIGATLYSANRIDFTIIKDLVSGLRIAFV